MSKKLNFIIPLVLYPFHIMVSIGQDDDELKKVLLKYGVEWDDLMKCEGMGRAVMTDRNQTILRLKEYPETNFDMGMLQHEIFHCTCFIMDRIGIKLSVEGSDEAYAYLIQYLTKEIYDRL